MTDSPPPITPEAPPPDALPTASPAPARVVWTLDQAKHRLREQGEVVERDIENRIEVYTGRIKGELKKASLWAAIGALGLGLSFGARAGVPRRSKTKNRDQNSEDSTPRRGLFAGLLMGAGRMALPYAMAILRRSARAAASRVRPHHAPAE